MIRPDITLVSDLIRNWFGLDFPENRWPDLFRGIKGAGSELGLGDDGLDFIELIKRSEVNAAQLDVLASHLTIGETYFFRERPAIESFSEDILPGIIRKKKASSSRSIRIWSAGCCSGEEPYTIAMILSDTIPDISSWDISILATDLNQTFLSKAKKGLYSKWSFRDTPQKYLKRYFTPQDQHFLLDSRIRQMVTFRRMNLISDPFPGENHPFFPLDVIFCRNVMMYCTPDIARQTGKRMVLALDPEGYLITSQVELTDDWFPGMRKEKSGDAFVYRKHLTNSNEREITDWKKVERKGKPRSSSSGKIIPASSFLKARAIEPPGKQTPIAAQEDPAEQIRELANQGHLEQALTMIREQLRADNENTSLLYLAGLLYLETGDPAEATVMLNKTLYLCPDHAMARYQICLASLKGGDYEKASRQKAILLNLLSKMDDKAIVPDSEGLTAGSLRKMINLIIS